MEEEHHTRERRAFPIPHRTLSARLCDRQLDVVRLVHRFQTFHFPSMSLKPGCPRWQQVRFAA